MKPGDIVLALAAVVIWGTNFVVIKVGLRDLPPFLFALLRFAFSALPWIFFLERPRVRWRWLVLFGLTLGAGQFGLLFYAMRADISPGLASLVIQTQVFFTIGLSIALFRERPRAPAFAGMLLAVAGIALIAANLDATVTAKGMIAVLGAAACWAAANTIVKKASREGAFRMLPFVAWSSLFSIPPLVAMWLGFEGWSVGVDAIRHASLDAWAAVAWQVLGNTLFAFAVWGWLLSRYDAAVVSPYALLIPVFGIGASTLLLAEPLPAWKIAAAALVIAGVALNTFWSGGRSPRAR